jgi:hypothetical protein
MMGMAIILAASSMAPLLAEPVKVSPHTTGKMGAIVAAVRRV